MALKQSLRKWTFIKSAAEKLSQDKESELTELEKLYFTELDFESPVCKEISFMARSKDGREAPTVDMFPPYVCSLCPVRQDYLKTGEAQSDNILCCVDYDVVYGIIGNHRYAARLDEEDYKRALPYIDAYIERIEMLILGKVA
jgi:hypothetical protein